MAVFADHNSSAMINKDASAQLGTGVNFNAGKEARQVGDEPGQEGNVAIMEPVGQAVGCDRVQPRIAAQHFQPVAGGRVALEDDGKIVHQRNLLAHSLKGEEWVMGKKP